MVGLGLASIVAQCDPWICSRLKVETSHLLERLEKGDAKGREIYSWSADVSCRITGSKTLFNQLDVAGFALTERRPGPSLLLVQVKSIQLILLFLVSVALKHGRALSLSPAKQAFESK